MAKQMIISSDNGKMSFYKTGFTDEEAVSYLELCKFSVIYRHVGDFSDGGKPLQSIVAAKTSLNKGSTQRPKRRSARA